MRDLLVAACGANVTLAGGRVGSFEITIDGKLRFSKLDSGRFPEDDEVEALAGGR